MRSWMLLPLLLAPLLVVLGASTGCGGGGSGHLSASEEMLDFKRVVQGEAPVRQVRVKNEGRKGVVLTAAIPSCKCLEIDPSFQRSLQAGESTEIQIRLRSGIVDPQKFENKHLEVRSDDPAMPLLRVALHGEIVARYTVTPTMLRVGPDDAAGRGEPRRIKLRTPAGMTAEVQPPEISHPAWFTVTPEKVADGIDLVLKVVPDAARRGPVDAVIKLKVRVTGRGLPPESYTPEIRVQGTW